MVSTIFSDRPKRQHLSPIKKLVIPLNLMRRRFKYRILQPKLIHFYRPLKTKSNGKDLFKC